MYKLASKIDLDIFKDKVLIQACFGENEIILSFDPNLSVLLTSSISCISASGDVRRYKSLKESSTDLVKMLGFSTKYATGNEAGTLTVKFENEEAIEIYDDSDQFESFIIKNGAEVIVS